MSDWSKFKLPELRSLATTYNKEVKLSGVSKMKRADLITELDKHLSVEYNESGEHKVTIKNKTGSIETKKQAGEKEAKKVYAQYKTVKQAGEVAASKALNKTATVAVAAAKKARKARSDKGAKHTYPEGRKERNDKGKKRK